MCGVWLGQTNWIQMEMCMDFFFHRRCYLHSNHRQLGEPIYASLFRSLHDEGKPSRPFLVGKKSDEFSSFIYYFVSLSRSIASNAIQYIVAQIEERSGIPGRVCVCIVNQTEVTTIQGKKEKN